MGSESPHGVSQLLPSLSPVNSSWSQEWQGTITKNLSLRLLRINRNTGCPERLKPTPSHPGVGNGVTTCCSSSVCQHGSGRSKRPHQIWAKPRRLQR